MDEAPYYTLIFLACQLCHARRQEGALLQPCEGCQRVCYCSDACREDDRVDHDRFCKALAAVEKDPTSAAPLLAQLGDKEACFRSTIEQANYYAKAQGRTKALMVKLMAREQLTHVENNLIAFEPRCIICSRTAQDIRMEEAIKPSDQPFRSIRSCRLCILSFYCSDEHDQDGYHIHNEIPYEDGDDCRSQCQMNQEIMMDLKYAEFMSKKDPLFRGTYESGEMKKHWSSLEGETWQGNYMPPIPSGMDKSDRIMTILRHDSDILTVPMTILFALEKLNGQDCAWTRKDVLTIHFIGADFHEMQRWIALEELFHRLPNLRKIKILLCGPELPSIAGEYRNETSEWSAKSCSPCMKRGVTFLVTSYAGTYHAFVKNEGKKYTPPDIAVAFNSGCGVGLETQQAAYQMLDIMSNSSSWRKTERFLIERRIPTVFTASNAEDAVNDEQRLISSGAKFVPGLGRRRNPWGSLLTHTRPNMVRGFESYNRWIVGGFR